MIFISLYQLSKQYHSDQFNRLIANIIFSDLISLSLSLQPPGWVVNSMGSVSIATANEDALGLYTCTPYNSYGTVGQSAATRVVLQVLNQCDENRLGRQRDLYIPNPLHSEASLEGV